MTTSLPRLRRALITYYRRHRRDLPWRRTRDPYAIWVSEIMLQQTQVGTVARRYGEFLARFPHVQALAAASPQEVCEAWAGLGYYRRALALQAAAEVVVREHHAELPRRAAELVRLPGIGRYTAGAIASIAFGEEAPVLDGNVARVLARLNALAGQSESVRVKRALWAYAAELVRGEAPGDLNQALMELGATVCTPRTPSCAACPVSRWCRARALGRPERYPAVRAARARKRLHVAFAWIETRRGVYLVQRPLTGLWSGLWELPSAIGGRARADLAARLGVSLTSQVACVQHTLTHREVTARVFVPAAHPEPLPGFVAYPDPLAAPLSALARKAILATGAALTRHVNGPAIQRTAASLRR